MYLPEKIQLSRHVRGAEYLAGRLAAKYCLRSLGVDTFDVYTDETGKPCWLYFMGGSISHTSKIAAGVLCAPDSPCCSVGIDVEEIVSVQDVDNLSSLIMAEDEYAFLFSIRDSKEKIFTLIFSAQMNFWVSGEFIIKQDYVLTLAYIYHDLHRVT